MDTKHEGQMKPVIQEWYFSNSLVSLLGILAPAAFLAIIFGHSGTFIDFLFNTDYWKIKDPRCTKVRKKPQDIHFSKWLHNFLSRLKFKNDKKCEVGTESPRDIWKDGSILCNLVNMIVPGACKDPRLHRLQTPQHGQKLVYDYLDINPIFTPLELSQKSLSQTQEKRFAKYLNKIYQIIRKDNDNINNMKFSTDYVARGMGLVVAQQNQKSTFYIYPIPKQYPNTCDLDILIKGPCGNNGKITIPSISQHIQKCQPSTEYKRTLHMSSKLNSISPTLQGTSFLRKLSLSSEDSRSEIDIRVKLSTNRAKVSYVPNYTGIYEISLVTRGCHVVGSPYSVPVELSTFSNCSSNDTDSENEYEGKYTYKKTKVISRIVDFVDEKMLLQDDGTLVKIDENHKQNEEYLETNKNYSTYKCRLKSNNILKTENSKKSFFKNDDINNKNNNLNSEGNKKLNKITNENLDLDTSKEEISYNLENTNSQDYLNTDRKNILNNLSEKENRNYIFNKKLQPIKVKYPLEENNNYIETRANMNLSKLSKATDNSTYFMQNIEEENNNMEDLSNIQNNQFPDKLEKSAYTNSVSASFTKVNDPQILNSSDPTFKSKVQDPQNDLKKTPRKDLRKGIRIAEESFKFSTSSNGETNNNSIQIFDHDTSLNTSTNDEATDFALLKLNQNPNTLKKHMKKMGAILDNYDEHQCSLKSKVNYNMQQNIDETNNQQIDDTKSSISNNKLSLVAKQKQFWLEKTTSSLTNTSEPARHPIPSKILKSSFDRISSESNEDKYIGTIEPPFEGIVENNIKLFEIKLNTETPSQNKTSFKIDIPKFNLNETIIVRNIEIVTNTEEEVIKLETLEERKLKFLQACNKPIRPKRRRNKVSVTRNDCCNNKEDIADDGQIDCTKLNSVNLEKIIQGTEKSNTEPNVSVRRKYRFKRAKLYFQSLEKPSNKSDREESSEKKLGIISIQAESDLNNTRAETKNMKHDPCLRKSHSDSVNLLRNSNESKSKLPRSESDSCIQAFSKQRTPIKISERFQVTGLFRDVLEDSRFIGLPNKKAVVASLASLESNCDPLMDHLNSCDVNGIDYFETRRKNSVEHDNIPGYHKEFPHIPNRNQWNHRSRNNPEITGLIPGRKLLTSNVENLIL